MSETLSEYRIQAFLEKEAQNTIDKLIEEARTQLTDLIGDLMLTVDHEYTDEKGNVFPLKNQKIPVSSFLQWLRIKYEPRGEMSLEYVPRQSSSHINTPIQKVSITEKHFSEFMIRFASRIMDSKLKQLMQNVPTNDINS